VVAREGDNLGLERRISAHDYSLPRKTLNRHDAKIARGLMFQPFQRKTRNQAPGAIQGFGSFPQMAS
jgi:hypothetical protein